RLSGGKCSLVTGGCDQISGFRRTDFTASRLPSRGLDPLSPTVPRLKGRSRWASSLPFHDARRSRRGRVLDLDPIAASAGPVGAIAPFRNDAFKPNPAGVGEDGRALRAVEMLGKPDARYATDRPGSRGGFSRDVAAGPRDRRGEARGARL